MNSFPLTSKIYVAGHRGLVGSAIVRMLRRSGYSNIVTRARDELNLLDSVAVTKFLSDSQPDCIIDAAAKVGGIHANNTLRGQFIYENLTIQNNLIHGAWQANINKLLFLGSSCIYPRECPQPILEEYLLSGPLEPTNQPYAIAKIAGIEMCQSYNAQYQCNFTTAMPTNLYGPGDNFDLSSSHVLPALIAKAHKAKIENALTLKVWGSGNPLREFLFVDDLAAACLHLLTLKNAPGIINIGSGYEISIRDLAKLICTIVGFSGTLEFDASKPDGTPRKLLDCSKMNALGWRAATDLPQGIKTTYEWYLEHK